MPSYLSYLKHIQDAQQDDNIESWITVNGNHIPIMKGESKATAVRRFIEERRAKSTKNDGIIRYGNKDYGKPGTYEVFRTGKLNAPRGTIFTASTFAHANSYANTQGDRETVERYNVRLKNPLTIEGSSDVDNLRKTYKQLFGKEINPNKPLDQDTWPKYDEMIMRKLKKTKYDAIITSVNGKPKEIQLPDWTPMVQTGSYKRYDTNWEDEEYKSASKEDKVNSENYWNFVNNEYQKGNEEHEKKELELRAMMTNTFASAVNLLKTDDYYFSQNDKKTVRAFHGGSEDIERFSLKHAGKVHGTQYGTAFYFTSDEGEAGGFGSVVGKYDLVDGKTINPENRSDITAQQINNISKKFIDTYIKTPEAKKDAWKISEELNNTPYDRSYLEVIDTYLLDLASYGDSDENYDKHDYQEKILKMIKDETGIVGYKIPREDGKVWYGMFDPDDIIKAKD